MAIGKTYLDAVTCTNQYTIAVCEDNKDCTYVDYSDRTLYYMTALSALIFYTVSASLFVAAEASGIKALAGAAFFVPAIIAAYQGLAASASYARFGRFGAIRNPGNQLAEFLTGKVYPHWMIALFAFLATTVLAVLAPILLRLFGSAQSTLDAAQYKYEGDFFQGLFVEVFISFMLSLILRAAANREDASFSVFAAVAAVVFVGAQYTGGFADPHLYIGYWIGNSINRGFDFGLFHPETFLICLLGPLIGWPAGAYSHNLFVQTREIRSIDEEKGY